MYRTHEMRMVQTAQSGHEEWACPTCGRRILLRWPPRYDKQIIEPGDEEACHVGSDPTDTPPEPGAPDTGAAAGSSEPHPDEAHPDQAHPDQADPDEADPDEAAVAHCSNGRRWLRETGREIRTAPLSPP